MPKPNEKIYITISGPTSSGKTTLAHEIISMLNDVGIDAVADSSVLIDSRYHNQKLEAMHEAKVQVIVREIATNRIAKTNP